MEKKIIGIERLISLRSRVVQKLRECGEDVGLIDVQGQLESIAREQQRLLCELYNQLLKLRKEQQT